MLMKSVITCAKIFCVLIMSLFYVGCELDDEKTELVIVLNSNCRHLSSVSISVDGVYWGNISPGQSLSREVGVGIHNITTDSRSFPASTVYVQENGLVYDLTCQ